MAHRKFLIALTCVAALATISPPARAQAEATRSIDPAMQAPSIRERWNALSQDEQQKLLENYEKWKRLDSDERTLLKRRFERLEVERRRACDTLDDDDRRRLIVCATSTAAAS